MAWIACQEVEDSNDPLECLDENWNDTNMCRYCADMEEYNKAIDLLGVV